jgi:hypothetical protein
MMTARANGVDRGQGAERLRDELRTWLALYAPPQLTGVTTPLRPDAGVICVAAPPGRAVALSSYLSLRQHPPASKGAR